MAFTTQYAASEPTAHEVAALPGLTLLEFGTPWCDFCRASQGPLLTALETAQTPGLRHLKIEDGKGRLLGRAYRVKLWPTLVFLKDGVEVARVVRPAQSDVIQQALTQLEAARVTGGAPDSEEPPTAGS